ncbi:efflux RND transporter periplasmic adaptor subunit [Limnohabitans sp. Rim8]|uniref:efflux RND transporter periplasmic adaptor subunit n=1 Tax=Limnohabitans sp. Rim8 TaxID=1100718 RepID=UPI003305EC7B
MSSERHSSLALHSTDVQDPHDLVQRRQVIRSSKIAAATVVLLLLVGGARTVLSQSQKMDQLKADVQARSQIYVKTTVIKVREAGQTIALPGSLQGYVQSPIYARVPGYVKKWHKDIGSRVRKGEVLAELETPETEELLSQALATRQQATASLELAKSTEARWIALRSKDAVSQQEVDEKRSNSTQAQANLAAAEANMQRLKQLSNFKSLLSPTDGVITRRNVDTGDLVDAGAVGGLPRALFVVTQTDPLRLFVNVPQTYAQQIKPGQTVIVRQTELQGQKFEGKLARTGASIDPLTRSMQVEISLPNKSGILLPGAFVQVDLPLQSKATLTIPNNALIIRAGAIKVAVVDAEKRVKMQVVTLGRNLGEQVEVTSGLKDGARLVLNPPDALSDGDQVNFVIDAPKEEGGAKVGGTKDTVPSEKAKP